jgi:dTDP-4-dehydrorhamnose 3,5-epimerase
MSTPENQPPKITPFEVQPTEIDGLSIITMKQVEDERGVIRELFRDSALREAGLTGFGPWKQINATETNQGTIRGLHAEEMWKLVAVVEGEAFGAYVDVRPDSPSRGMVVTTSLTKGMQVLVPQGVCNGFQSVSEGVTQYLYCFDAEWVLGMKGYSVNPLDPELGIDWPIPVETSNTDLISRKDASAPTLKETLGQTAIQST